MDSVTILGAGVIGSAYASLLHEAGHDVSLVARGSRAEKLRTQGVVVEFEDRTLTVSLPVLDAVEESTANLLLVAVRGDQLDAALDAAARSSASHVLMFANPLGRKAEVEERLGRDRIVWCFAGLGGEHAEDGAPKKPSDARIRAHMLAQQTTVVEDGSPGTGAARALFEDAGLPLHVEGDMNAWFDTHNLFVAAMSATALGAPLRTAGERRTAARTLVAAMREAFAALSARGVRITPQNLRMIFGPVPAPIAVLYWARQLGQPLTTVSFAPHARATRDTEMREICRRALDVAGPQATRFRALVEPFA